MQVDTLELPKLPNNAERVSEGGTLVVPYDDPNAELVDIDEYREMRDIAASLLSTLSATQRELQDVLDREAATTKRPT